MSRINFPWGKKHNIAHKISYFSEGRNISMFRRTTFIVVAVSMD